MDLPTLITYLKPLLPCIIPGILFGIGALGVYLISTYLRVTDLTTLGSFLIASIVAVSASNIVGPVTASIVGMLVGGAFGGLTAFCVCYLRVQIVLAGIASFSLAMSLAHFIAAGGSVKRQGQENAFLSSAFSVSDFLATSAIAIFLCMFVHVLMQTPFGGSILAMRAQPEYKLTRHRHRALTTTGILVFGHSLIGLSGSLSGLKTVSAGTELVNSADFMIIAFGAVFGGYVFASWSKRFGAFIVKKITTDVSLPDIGGEIGVLVRRKRSRNLTLIPPDLGHLGFLLGAIVFGCIVLNGIVLMTSKVSEALGYAIQAVCILGFAVCVGAKDQDSSI